MKRKQKDLGLGTVILMWILLSQSICTIKYEITNTRYKKSITIKYKVKRDKFTTHL